MPVFPSRIPSALSALVLLCVASAALAQGGPSPVQTERVEMRTLSETRPVFGQVVAQNDSTVATRVAGIVAEVGVLVGDRVEPDAMLAVLDRELIGIELAQAEANLAEAQAGIEVATARVARAEDAFARIDQLRGSNAFSEGRLEELRGLFSEAQGQLAQAQARLFNAQAAYDRALYNNTNARIAAPFRGIVLEVEADRGQYIAAGATVARILDITTLEIEASVPAQYVAGLEQGMSLPAETADGVPVDVVVRAILPTEAAATRTRPVRFSPADGELGALAAVGQSITVSVPTAPPREALSVPKDALTQGAQGWSVFVDDNGSAQPRTVQIGAAMGDRFEVLSGLTEGDFVVVRGNERLFPGQPIQATNAPADDEQGAAETAANPATGPVQN
ncbi:MAG: efflux RND transporter periplasmic adaptor subunit [Pseudomonadota bacterium]